MNLARLAWGDGEDACLHRAAVNVLEQRRVGGIDRSPGQREAVVLRYFEGFNCREVAAAMGTSVKAVERLLARAREALRPRLAASAME